MNTDAVNLHFCEDFNIDVSHGVNDILAAIESYTFFGRGRDFPPFTNDPRAFIPGRYDLAVTVV
jgi:hypothetical protein